MHRFSYFIANVASLIVMCDSSDQLSAAKSVLIEALTGEGKSEEYITSQLSMLFDDNAFLSRFTYINRHTAVCINPVVLVSGAAVGGELIGSLTYNPKLIVATEISGFYLEACRVRFKNVKTEIKYVKVENSKLDLDSNTFDLCLSGHIIEHTPDPGYYLRELFRVLKPGGVLFLEFPSRFSFRELHTNTFSLEWLPRNLRNTLLDLLIHILGSRDTAIKLKDVRETLSQISLINCMVWLRNYNYRFKVLNSSRASRGITRVLIMKR